MRHNVGKNPLDWKDIESVTYVTATTYDCKDVPQCRISFNFIQNNDYFLKNDHIFNENILGVSCAEKTRAIFYIPCIFSSTEPLKINK
jgi:hypothetical protein